MATCPTCDGEKQTYAHLNFGGAKPNEWRWVNCHQCDGTGEVSPYTVGAIAFGKLLGADRKLRLKTLRDEAKELGLSPSDLSAAEFGRATPELLHRVIELRATAGRESVGDLTALLGVTDR